MRPRVVSLIGEVRRNVLLLPLGAELVFPHERALGDEIDDALEIGLAADRKLDRKRVGAEPVLHGLDGALEVGAGAVHLVDVGDSRDAVLVRLAPDSLGLRLHSRHGVEEGNCSVEHAQGALHLDGEVDVTGSVDDVDAVIAPDARRRSGGDCYPALLLLLHPVHDSRALVDLTHLVGAPCVIENALGRGGLAGIDVGHDADVPELFEFDIAGHETLIRAFLVPSLGQMNALRQKKSPTGLMRVSRCAR